MDYKVIPEWKGTQLTNAAFLNYANDVLRVLNNYGDDETVPVAEQAAALTPDCELMADFVKNERAYSETGRITDADARRDALYYAVWHAWNYLSKLGKDDDIGKHAYTLMPLMEAYKGIGQHELARETAEINGLKHDLEANGDYRAAATALGFDPWLAALYAANATVQEWLLKRDATHTVRELDKRDETAPSLRKRMAETIVKAFRRINAKNEIDLNPNSYNAAADLCTVIDRYKKVAAQAKTRKGDDPDGGETPEQA